MPSPWSDSLKTETVQPKLPQHPSGTQRSGGTACPELSKARCCWGTLGPSRDGQLHPPCSHAGFSHQLGAFWCLLLSQRELPSGAEAGGSSEPPPGGVVPSAGKANRHRSPELPFGSSGKLFACTKICCCLFPVFPAVPISWSPFLYLKTAC